MSFPPNPPSQMPIQRPRLSALFVKPRHDLLKFQHTQIAPASPHSPLSNYHPLPDRILSYFGLKIILGNFLARYGRDCPYPK